MPNWSKNNRACLTTWSTLRILAQLSKPFDSAGAVTMGKLAMFNKNDDQAMRSSKALMLSIQLDNVFRDVRGARFETGVKQEAAVAEMKAVLEDDTKDVSGLAEVADDNYRFWQEGEL